MNKKILACAVIVIIILLCLCLGVGIYLVYRGISNTNNFVLIKDSGIVSYKTDGSYIQMKEPQITLSDKTFVKTAAGSAHILLPDNSLVSLDSDTEIQVNLSDKGVDIKQMAGNTWNRVEKLVKDSSYTVHTPSLLAGVRGTIFGVSISDTTEQVFVVKDTVAVSAGANNKDVTADNMAELTDGNLAVSATPTDITQSDWYLNNVELDKLWEQFSSSSRTQVLNKLFGQISEVPSGVNNFLSARDINSLKTNKFPVYTGFNPPNLSGTYTFDNWTVKYDKMNVFPAGKAINTCDYTFSNQTADGKVDVSYTCDSDSGSGKGSFVSGANNCFSVYVDQTGNYMSCNYYMPAVISGCLDSVGIKDLQYAIVMKSKENTTSCKEQMMPVGNLRTITIDDTHADKK